MAQRGSQGRAPRGVAQPASGPAPHPTSTSQDSSDAQTRARHVCKVLICHQLPSFGQKSPQSSHRVRSWWSPWSFHLWLCAGVRPLAHTAPQLSTGGAPPPPRCSLLSACDSIIRVTPRGQRHQVSKCTLQGPRNPESLGAGAGESSGVTAGPEVQAPLLLSSDFTLTKMKKLELLNWEILKYLCFILSKIYTMNLDSFCSEARLKQTRNKRPNAFRQVVALESR